MYENSTWITGIASEELKNNTFCIYNPNNQELRNIKNRHEIATNCFVFVDEPERFMGTTIINPTENIQIGQPVRCLRVHIMA